MRFTFISTCLFLISLQYCVGQNSYFRNEKFTKADTLRGALSAERTCFDVTHYDLTVEFDLEANRIKGQNKISFDLLQKSDSLQIDLFKNLAISSIFEGSKKLDFRREHNAVFVNISHLEKGKSYQFLVNYSGSPREAVNPPWDGGFQWTSDDNGDPWVHVSCQGLGASVWWPNKDHLSDEPDSMNINLLVPKGYQAISNGELVATYETDKKELFAWKVSYPINNYNVTFSIGKYQKFSEQYLSAESGRLACDYYVMPYNLEKAKRHFKQVKGVLEAFEHYLGPYPFWKDGYALVETPYLGMEHQSAIAYGNKYQRGYMGGMIPNHMNWDYIIVHETAHEYWGNAVTTNDYAELWLHESFTTYMEALYVEYHLGYDESIGYLATQNNHANNTPIIGPRDVNYHKFNNSDHYFKGSWVLHTLRNTINDDRLFFKIFRKFYESYKYKNANSEDFFRLVNTETGENYDAFFEQYLRHPEIPVLEYKLKQKGSKLRVSYRWNCKVEGFDMQIKLSNGTEDQIVRPRTGKWQNITLSDTDDTSFNIAADLFLVNTLRIRE